MRYSQAGTASRPGGQGLEGQRQRFNRPGTMQDGRERGQGTLAATNPPMRTLRDLKNSTGWTKKKLNNIICSYMQLYAVMDLTIISPS